MALATLLTGQAAATLTLSDHYSITVHEWVISG